MSVATDDPLYQTEVYAASHSPAALAALQANSSSAQGARSPASEHSSSPGHGKEGNHAKSETHAWRDRPVLLLGIRLGLDGVNPVYYETIKSVGIAGGRPSSPYYLVGVQGDGLFYLDPHHSRPAVPFRPFVPSSTSAHNHTSNHAVPCNGTAALDARRSLGPEAYVRGGSMSPEYGGHGGTGSMSSEGYVRVGSLSPDFASGHGHGHALMTEDELFFISRPLLAASEFDDTAGGHLTPAEATHYARASSTAELRNMLIGFVCRDEAEWVDLRRKVSELPRTIFAIQDEPPTWPGADDDADMGLESASDPEEVDDAGVDDGDVESAVSTSSHAASNSSPIAASAFSHTQAHSNSGEFDTEEHSVAPLAPLPGARFALSGVPPTAGKGRVAYPDLEGDDGFVDAGGEVEIEDDWVDPIVASPLPAPSKKPSASKGKGKGRKKAVPVPSVH
ncbi:hypothetical protein DFH09DRAFT_1088957 [Mycena vulgaris]|nr:hypothetical protein DFH09DRAFT_1088957 [Mycena vulgaris]